ncbi:MAG: tetratricopeptide repeat protein [Pseudomonadales bacterium]|nr:tetratricopeptide repeat protein [Pseudomonadales bacterium]
MTQPTHNPGSRARFGDLVEELQRRRVIRVATLYVVIFWPVIQVVDILSPALALPDVAMRYLVMGFVGLLPVVLILAWLFDLNRGGIVRDHGEGEHGRALISSHTELGIIGVMLLVVAGLFYVQWHFGDADGMEQVPVSESVMTPPRRSIAVLPFVPLSQDDRDRFFADGLTEELLNALSRVSGLHVAARTSSFAYRDVNKLVQTIGRELDVAVLLEGSVRRSDVENKIRITAQLVDTRDGSPFWSKTYDREFTDVFRIQDEIAASVVDELKLTLLDDEKRRLANHEGAKPEALITYSMGQTELARRTRQSIEDAERYFRRALDYDDDYVDAWVGLADANNLMVQYAPAERSRYLADARRAVDKALTLDPASGRAWASKGLLLRQESKKDEARAAFEKAIALSPSYAMAHMWYAPLIDDPELAFQHLEQAYKLDPRSPVAGYNVAREYLGRGRETDAMQVVNQIVEADPYYPRAYQLVGQISAQRGRLGEAIRQYEKAYELDPSADIAYDIADMMTAMGNFTGADEWIALARPHEPPERLYAYHVLYAKRYAMEGNVQRAREEMQAVEEPFGEYEAAYLVSSFAAFMINDYARAVASWEKAMMLRKDGSNEIAFSTDTLESARVGAAFSYRALGQDDKAARLLREARINLDAEIARGAHGSDVWYRTAQVSELEGQSELALINLQRAVDEGWTEFWRPGLDPVFAGLVKADALEAMMAGLETRMNLMREQFAFEESFASSREAGPAGS